MRSRHLGLAVVSAMLVLTGCASPETGGTGAVQGGEVDSDGLHGTALTEPYSVPDTPLTDTAGEAYSLTDADADLTLVFFGYTHCPDICGIVMSTVASALTRLDDAERERVEMVFVTTDPARDDPDTLRDYLDQYDPAFEGATGELPTIIETARALAVHVEQGEKLPSGGYEVVHSDPVVGLDDQDRATTVWTKDISSAQLAEDIEKLLAQ